MLDKDRGALEGLLQDWGRAFCSNDADTISKFMADDWMLVGPDGTVSEKGAFLSLIRSGKLTHARMDFDDFRIRCQSDTAIVCARATVSGTYNGNEFRTQERSTDMFVRTATGWLSVFSQLTTITTQAPPE